MTKRKGSMLGYCVRCNKPFIIRTTDKTCSQKCSHELNLKRMRFFREYKMDFMEYYYKHRDRILENKRKNPNNKILTKKWKIKNKKAYGLWVCQYCHVFVERIDKKIFAKKYKTLREKIELEF